MNSCWQQGRKPCCSSLSVPWGRTPWRALWWGPGRSLGAALGGWWCQRPTPPAAVSGRVRRSALSHSEPQLVAKDTKYHTFCQKRYRCQGCIHHDGKIPRLERVLDRSMMALLLGLLRTDLLASDMSAVTRVIDILGNFKQKKYVTVMSSLHEHSKQTGSSNIMVWFDGYQGDQSLRQTIKCPFFYMQFLKLQWIPTISPWRN